MRTSGSSILVSTLLLLFLAASLYFIVYPVESSRLFRSKGAFLQESFASPGVKGIRECSCLPGFMPGRIERMDPSKGYQCINIQDKSKKTACY